MYRLEIFKNPDDDGHRFFAEHLRGGDQSVTEARAWCTEKFGKPAVIGTGTCAGSRWAGDWNLWFRDEEDAFQFKMRWC